MISWARIGTLTALFQSGQMEDEIEDCTGERGPVLRTPDRSGEVLTARPTAYAEESLRSSPAGVRGLHNLWENLFVAGRERDGAGVGRGEAERIRDVRVLGEGHVAR